MIVDGDRAQVYAAEVAAFDGTDLERIVGIDVVRSLVAAVTALDWWPRGDVSVHAARRDAASSSTRCSVDGSGDVTIRIARPQATFATAAHELAHVLAGVEEVHGPAFRQAHLDVVGAMTNLDRLDARGALHAHQLREAYAAVSLAIGRRTWSQPPDLGGAIAL